MVIPNTAACKTTSWKATTEETMTVQSIDESFDEDVEEQMAQIERLQNRRGGGSEKTGQSLR